MFFDSRPIDVILITFQSTFLQTIAECDIEIPSHIDIYIVRGGAELSDVNAVDFIVASAKAKVARLETQQSLLFSILIHSYSDSLFVICHSLSPFHLFTYFTGLSTSRILIQCPNACRAKIMPETTSREHPNNSQNNTVVIILLLRFRHLLSCRHGSRKSICSASSFGRPPWTIQ